jgi:hypothetical protein
MITNFNKTSKQILGSSLLLPAYGWEGQGQYSLAVHFAKQNTKNCGGEKARAGREFLSPQPPFLTRPARAKFSKINFRIFVKKSSDFVQKVPPFYNFSVLREVCLALATLGLGFGKDFEGKFEIQK